MPKGLICKFVLAGIAGTGFWVAIVNGQGKAPSGKLRFDVVPTILGPTVSAVGPRLSTKDKERTVLSGQYIDDSGKQSPVQVVQQLPNLVSLTGFGPGNAPLKFDGRNSPARKTTTDEMLLETFVSDTCEGMLTAIQNGAAVRLLGRHFRPDSGTNPNYKGPGFDIYEVTAPEEEIADRPTRVKHYFFDSSSGLLAMTQYTDSTRLGISVEVRFSNWQKVDGSAYPGQIDRYEGGRRIFSVILSSVSNGARRDPSNFGEVSNN